MYVHNGSAGADKSRGLLHIAEAECLMCVQDGSGSEWERQKTRLRWRANRQGAFTP